METILEINLQRKNHRDRYWLVDSNRIGFSETKFNLNEIRIVRANRHAY